MLSNFDDAEPDAPNTSTATTASPSAARAPVASSTKQLAAATTATTSIADDDEEEEDEDDEGFDDEETSVDLGFLATPLHPLALQRTRFPSKVGGRPAWLHERLPSAEQFVCGRCRAQLRFLGQIYAPIRGDEERSARDDTFHRTLFVFVCTRSSSPSSSASSSSSPAAASSCSFVACFRSQLPLHNSFYSAQPPAALSKPSRAVANKLALSVHESQLLDTPLCARCGCPAVLEQLDTPSRLRRQPANSSSTADSANQFIAHFWHCSDECARIDRTLQSKANDFASLCSLRLASLWPESQLVMETEYIAAQAPEDLSRERQLLAQYELRRAAEMEEEKASAAADDDADDDAEDDFGLSSLGSLHRRDRFFALFRRRIAHNPEQVLRYEREGSPLWVSDQPQLVFASSTILSNSSAMSPSIPSCDRCHGPRVFEFQLLPQLIYLLQKHSVDSHHVLLEADVDLSQQHLHADLDFGTIAVYTCAASCPLDEHGYASEVCVLQQHSELVMVEAPEDEVNDEDETS